MCIDIVEIWFGIANWQTASILDRVICPSHVSGGALSFHVCIWSCFRMFIRKCSKSSEENSIFQRKALRAYNAGFSSCDSFLQGNGFSCVHHSLGNSAHEMFKIVFSYFFQKTGVDIFISRKQVFIFYANCHLRRRFA